MKILYSLVCLGLFTFSCVNPGKPEKDQNNQAEYTGDGTKGLPQDEKNKDHGSEKNWTVQGTIPDNNAGRGFDSQTQNQMQHCLGGKVSLDSGTSGSSSGFERVTDIEQLRTRMIFGSVETEKQGVINHDLAKNHLAAIVDTELTSTYHFVNTYILGTKRIDNIFFRVPTEKHGIFEKNCGDEYINGVLIGGIYVASVKFQFSSKEIKETFSFDFDFSAYGYGQDEEGVRYGVDKTKISESEQKNVKIEILTLQIGGGGRPGPDYRIGNALRCDLENEMRCMQILQTIGAYGNTIFHEAITAAPAVLSFGTHPYPL